MNFIEGETLYIDKPYKLSSFGALSRVRYLITQKLGVKKIKVGHAGTLDPLATGVLILCTGRATKSIDQIQALTKEYTATLQLGATTPSFDMEHPVDATYPTAHITKELIETTLQQFIGEISQIPPSYSACKVDGKRAYQMMRDGEEVELKAKILKIDEIELTSFDSSNMTMGIRVVCSKGTYIRALARDIGKALGSGAYLTELRRTRVGNVTIDKCMTLEEFPAWLDSCEIEMPQNETNKGNSKTK